MTWFDDVQIEEGADEAAEWAATREYELRYRRSTIQREGLSGGLRKATAAINRFNAALAGDPSVPKLKDPKTKLGTQSEARGLLR